MSLQEKVDAIPGDNGWWKKSSRDTYQKAALMLVLAGVEEDEPERIEALRSALLADRWQNVTTRS